MRFNTEALLVFGNWFLLGATLYLMGNLGGELLYWQILNIPVSSIAPASHASTSISPDQDQKRERFQIITDRNVFDAQKTEVYVPPPEPEPAPVPEQEEKAPEINDQIEPTKLQIALTGTMIYGKGSSFAFISQQSNLNQYNIYQIGDCFHPKTVKRDKECNEDSVKVLEITDRRVVILHRGKKQALRMQESKGFETSPPVRKKTVLKSSALIVTVPEKPKAVSKKKSRKKKKKNVRAPGNPDPNQRSFNFERIWVDEQLEQFDQLLLDARVVPTKKGEKTFFMFQFIKDESIYRKLGLQTNDIILEVNGYTVDSVAKALKLLEALQSEREISLKIEREGQPIDFSYFID